MRNRKDTAVLAARKFIGLDVHQDTIAIAIADQPAGKEIRFLGTIPNTSEALHAALTQFSQVA